MATSKHSFLALNRGDVRFFNSYCLHESYLNVIFQNQVRLISVPRRALCHKTDFCKTIFLSQNSLQAAFFWKSDSRSEVHAHATMARSSSLQEALLQGGNISVLVSQISLEHPILLCQTGIAFAICWSRALAVLVFLALNFLAVAAFLVAAGRRLELLGFFRVLLAEVF